MQRIIDIRYALISSFPDALWPLLSWGVVKVIGASPTYLAAMITNDFVRSQWRELVLRHLCTDHANPQCIPNHVFYALSPSWCRKFRKLAKREIRSKLKEIMSDPETKAGFLAIRRLMLRVRFLAALRSRVEALESTTAAIGPSQESQEWARRLEDAFYNPKRAGEYVPARDLLGPKEAEKLIDDIGAEHYGEVLQSLMWQSIKRPGSLERTPMRVNHPMWEKVGVNPTKEVTSEESVGMAFTTALRIMDTLSPQDWLRYSFGSSLRQQYGLSRDRKTETESDREATAETLEEQSGESGTAYQADYEDPKAQLAFDGIIDQMETDSILQDIEATLTPAEFHVLQIKIESEAHGDFKELIEATGMSYASARVLLNRSRKKLRHIFPNI